MRAVMSLEREGRVSKCCVDQNGKWHSEGTVIYPFEGKVSRKLQQFIKELSRCS